MTSWLVACLESSNVLLLICLRKDASCLASVWIIALPFSSSNINRVFTYFFLSFLFHTRLFWHFVKGVRLKFSYFLRRLASKLPCLWNFIIFLNRSTWVFIELQTCSFGSKIWIRWWISIWFWSYSSSGHHDCITTSRQQWCPTASYISTTQRRTKGCYYTISLEPY